jgi:hypothetical protein
MDDRKDSTSPASHCAAFGAESESIADDARLPSESQVDTYCFHGDELSQGVAAALRIMGFDTHCLEGGIGVGAEQGLPSRRNTDDVDLQ